MHPFFTGDFNGHSSGGLMVTQQQRVEKLKILSFFPWNQHLGINQDPNWQVKTFTKIFLNIISNFIPSERKRIVPRDPPWITKPLKTMLNRKNRLFLKTTKDMAINQNTKSGLITFVMNARNQSKLRN